MSKKMIKSFAEVTIHLQYYERKFCDWAVMSRYVECSCIPVQHKPDMLCWGMRRPHRAQGNSTSDRIRWILMSSLLRLNIQPISQALRSGLSQTGVLRTLDVPSTCMYTKITLTWCGWSAVEWAGSRVYLPAGWRATECYELYVCYCKAKQLHLCT